MIVHFSPGTLYFHVLCFAQDCGNSSTLAIELLQFAVPTYTLWCRGSPCSGSSISSHARSTAGLVVHGLIRSQSTIHTLLLCVIPVCTRRACHWNIPISNHSLGVCLTSPVPKPVSECVYFAGFSQTKPGSGKPWNHCRFKLADSDGQRPLLLT